MKFGRFVHSCVSETSPERRFIAFENGKDVGYIEGTQMKADY